MNPYITEEEVKALIDEYFDGDEQKFFSYIEASTGRKAWTVQEKHKSKSTEDRIAEFRRLQRQVKRRAESLMALNKSMLDVPIEDVREFIQMFFNGDHAAFGQFLDSYRTGSVPPSQIENMVRSFFDRDVDKFEHFMHMLTKPVGSGKLSKSLSQPVYDPFYAGMNVPLSDEAAAKYRQSKAQKQQRPEFDPLYPGMNVPLK